MKILSHSILVLLLTACCWTDAAANEGTALIDQAFESESIPKNWQPGGRKGSFTIVDGHLRGVARPDDSHGPSIGVPIKAHDVTIEFDVMFAKPNGYFLFLLDGDSQFKGQAHLLRCALTPKHMQLSQDRGDPASKVAQKKQRDANGGKRTPPTKEQLSDETFYRVEPLAKHQAKTNDGEWHHIKIDVNKNNVTAWFDKDDAVKTTASVLDVPKSRIVFLVGQSGDIRIDNVKLIER